LNDALAFGHRRFPAPWPDGARLRQRVDSRGHCFFRRAGLLRRFMRRVDRGSRSRFGDGRGLEFCRGRSLIGGRRAHVAPKRALDQRPLRFDQRTLAFVDRQALVVAHRRRRLDGAVARGEHRLFAVFREKCVAKHEGEGSGKYSHLSLSSRTRRL